MSSDDELRLSSKRKSKKSKKHRHSKPSRQRNRSYSEPSVGKSTPSSDESVREHKSRKTQKKKRSRSRKERKHYKELSSLDSEENNIHKHRKSRKVLVSSPEEKIHKSKKRHKLRNIKHRPNVPSDDSTSDSIQYIHRKRSESHKKQSKRKFRQKETNEESTSRKSIGDSDFEVNEEHDALRSSKYRVSNTSDSEEHQRAGIREFDSSSSVETSNKAPSSLTSSKSEQGIIKEEKLGVDLKSNPIIETKTRSVIKTIAGHSSQKEKKADLKPHSKVRKLSERVEKKVGALGSKKLVSDNSNSLKNDKLAQSSPMEKKIGALGSKKLVSDNSNSLKNNKLAQSSPMEKKVGALGSKKLVSDNSNSLKNDKLAQSSPMEKKIGALGSKKLVSDNSNSLKNNKLAQSSPTEKKVDELDSKSEAAKNSSTDSIPESKTDVGPVDVSQEYPVENNSVLSSKLKLTSGVDDSALDPMASLLFSDFVRHSSDPRELEPSTSLIYCFEWELGFAFLYYFYQHRRKMYPGDNQKYGVELLMQTARNWVREMAINVLRTHDVKYVLVNTRKYFGRKFLRTSWIYCGIKLDLFKMVKQLCPYDIKDKINTYADAISEMKAFILESAKAFALDRGSDNVEIDSFHWPRADYYANQPALNTDDDYSEDESLLFADMVLVDSKWISRERSKKICQGSFVHDKKARMLLPIIQSAEPHLEKAVRPAQESNEALHSWIDNYMMGMETDASKPPPLFLDQVASRPSLSIFIRYLGTDSRSSKSISHTLALRRSPDDKHVRHMFHASELIVFCQLLLKHMCLIDRMVRSNRQVLFVLLISLQMCSVQFGFEMVVEKIAAKIFAKMPQNDRTFLLQQLGHSEEYLHLLLGSNVATDKVIRLLVLPHIGTLNNKLVDVLVHLHQTQESFEPDFIA